METQNLTQNSTKKHTLIFNWYDISIESNKYMKLKQDFSKMQIRDAHHIFTTNTLE